MVSNDDRSSHPTRRTLLRHGAAVAAAGLTIPVAGCASGLPPLGAARRFGRIDTPSADPPRFRRWLPAPAAVDGLDGSHYPFLFRRPSRLDYPAPVRFTAPRKRILASLDHFGVGYAAFDGLLTSPLGVVAEGDFDPATVARTLTGSGYAAAGRYRDYDLFARSDVPRTAAVGDGAVVWASHRVHDHPAVETLIDARDGRVPRYHEARRAVRRLTDTVGESRMVEFIPPESDRTWSKCEGFRFDGRTAFHVMTFLYPPGTTPPEAELRERSKEGTILTRPVENTEFRIDGRLVIVEGRIPPGAGIPPDEISPPYPPQITWGYDRGDGSLTIRHEAGDPVPADALAVRFERDAPDEFLVGTESRPFPTDAETVGPGDTATVDLGTVPAVDVIPRGEVDPGDADPFSAAESRPATRVAVAYGPDNPSRSLFAVALGGER